MEKKTLGQRLRLTDNKMAYGLLTGIGMGLAMGVALGDWATGVAIGAGVGTALGAGWSEQAKNKHKEQQ